MARAEVAALQEALHGFIDSQLGSSQENSGGAFGENDGSRFGGAERDTPGGSAARAHTHATSPPVSSSRRRSVLAEDARAVLEDAEALLDKLQRLEPSGGDTPGRRSAMAGGGTAASHHAAFGDVFGGNR